MSDIGLFGGRGTSEESYLQNARCQYTVLDEEEVSITHEYRRFKFLIFPSRFSIFAESCADSIIGNTNFLICMERFLERGGRILLCPPLNLPSDHKHHQQRGKDYSIIDWLPIPRLTLNLDSLRSRKDVSIKINQADHLICENLIGNEKINIYGYFSVESIPNAQVIISTSRGIPLITQIPVGAGFILVNAIDWPFLNPALPDLTNLFNSILDWGRRTPSFSITFNSLVRLVRTRIGNHEAHLLERADQSILSGKYSEACDHAFRAFERILRAKGGMDESKSLFRVIEQVFSEQESEKNFSHGIRELRNHLAHGNRLPEEITIEETECLFGSIKFVLSRLL